MLLEVLEFAGRLGARVRLSTDIVGYDFVRTAVKDSGG